ncbi:MAG: 6-phosphogluconolactonase [Acidobacteriota bacterium]|nr:6-phosphogluconolactonase [Acidobacteriota bacterium]
MATPDIGRDIRIFVTAEEVARAAADCFTDIAVASISAEGRFSVALAGGATPRRTYQLLASPEYRNRITWSQVHIFFGDERCVPPTHADSNYRMADEAILSHLPIPEQNVHRMIGEGDAHANASLYESDLQTFFDGEPWPRLNLVLLGMGDDGHTASLFPGTDALNETRGWVAANWVGKIEAYRITLTAPAINHAANIIFLVAGAGKAERLPEVLRGARDPLRLPSQLIQPVAGSLVWLVDKAAAERL